MTSESSPKDIYLGLRSQIFGLSPGKIGIALNAPDTEPFAAVMDWGLAGGVATVVAIADGTVSIYLSSGGGSIGGGQGHPSIRQAGRDFLNLAKQSFPRMHSATEYPLPEVAGVFFYVCTKVGVFSTQTSEKELNLTQHPLRNLGDAAQRIISEYRVVQQSAQKK
jgi:hypothetical protein